MVHRPDVFPGDMDRRELSMQPYGALVIDLGDQNEGDFGPSPEMAANYDHLVAQVANPENRRKPTGNWVCVDGRGDLEGKEDDGEYADGQIPGSLPITNTAGDMMDSTIKAPRLKALVTKNTREAVMAGHKVTLHGDEHNGKDGCAANTKMRATLAKIAASADIIAPRAWDVAEVTGLAQWIEQDDITEAIVTAGERAADDGAWNATPSEVIDAAIEAGATYQVLAGNHQEVGVVATLQGTYATQKFAQEHPTQEGRQELFGLSAGEYVATMIRDTLANGGTERNGALKAMRGIVYSLGLCTKIGNKDLRVIALMDV